MSSTVRPADLSECEDLAVLMDEALHELASQRGGAALLHSEDRASSSIKTFENALLDASTMVWSGYWFEALAGYAIASASLDKRPIVSLSDIYTTPEARKVGVGEALLEAAISWAESLDAEAIDAHALPGARDSKNLFERFGLTARLIVVRRDLR
ncbi:MAG: GNAT family N-acetyltransferase [Acidimicrobiales bacterium]